MRLDICRLADSLFPTQEDEQLYEKMYTSPEFFMKQQFSPAIKLQQTAGGFQDTDHTHTRIHIHTHVHHVYTDMYAHNIHITHTYTCTHIFTHVHICTHKYTTHTHMYTQAYTHTHTHVSAGKGRGLVAVGGIIPGDLLLVSEPAGKVVCGPEGADLRPEQLIAHLQAEGALSVADR